MGIRPLRARLFTDREGKWRFTILAPNGEPVAQSEGYSRRVDCIATAHLLGAVIEEGEDRTDPG